MISIQYNNASLVAWVSDGASAKIVELASPALRVPWNAHYLFLQESALTFVSSGGQSPG